MTYEKEVIQEEQPEVPNKKGSKAILIIVLSASIILGAGGLAGYKLLAGKQGDAVSEAKGMHENTSIIPLDPFVLNLSDRGRYLKFTIQFEVSDSSLQVAVKSKSPQLRDTIITLVSSKSINSISSPEGKFQLKDEVLFRANHIMGMEKNVFKNLYFTEFIMQ
jgi:flagellar FliL protein